MPIKSSLTLYHTEAHIGGSVKPAVKSTKHHLKRLVADSNITYETFSTRQFNQYWILDQVRCWMIHMISNLNTGSFLDWYHTDCSPWQIYDRSSCQSLEIVATYHPNWANPSEILFQYTYIPCVSSFSNYISFI